MMRSWVLVLVGACYAPTPSPGAPCAENQACPSGLVCALDGRCELAIGTVDAAGPLDDGTVGPDVPNLTDAGVIDAAPANTCWAAWQSGAPVLSAPVVVAELATPADEGDPAMAGSGLAIFFRRGTGASSDIYRATRPTLTSPFGPANVVPELSGAQEDSKVSLSLDGLTAILATKRPTGVESNLYEVTRTSAALPFDAPVELPGAVDDFNDQFDPDLSADGLVLYYSSRPLGVAGSQAILRTARATLGDAFAAPTTIAIGGTSGAVADPVVSPDERVMLYTSANNIYLATRATTSAPYAAVASLDAINTTSYEGDATLTRDGCELFFSSDRGGGGRDLYRAEVTPQ